MVETRSSKKSAQASKETPCCGKRDEDCAPEFLPRDFAAVKLVQECNKLRVSPTFSAAEPLNAREVATLLQIPEHDMFDLFADGDIWRLLERLGFQRKRDRHADAIGSLSLGYQITFPAFPLCDETIGYFAQQLKTLRWRGKLKRLSSEIEYRSEIQGKKWEYHQPQGGESSRRREDQENQSLFTGLDASERIHVADAALGRSSEEKAAGLAHLLTLQSSAVLAGSAEALLRSNPEVLRDLLHRQCGEELGPFLRQVQEHLPDSYRPVALEGSPQTQTEQPTNTGNEQHAVTRTTL